jgi:IS5 family transposase
LATPDPATRRSRENRLARAIGRRLVFSGEKRGAAVGIGRKGKGTTILLLTDGNDFPLSAHIAGADEHEVNHVSPLLDVAVVHEAFWQPTHLLYDKAADDDELWERLEDRCIELVCPRRDNRKRPRTQDGRKLRRYRHRWRIERSISWLQRFKRLVVRYEYHADLFLGFVQLACLFTILQRF